MGSNPSKDEHDFESGADTTSEEKVGYGKPPRHSRFKPGCSGNPRGRPKGASGCKTIVRRVALEEREVIEQGRVVHRTVLELVLSVVCLYAARGNAKALIELDDLLERFGPRELDPSSGPFLFLTLAEPTEEELEQDRQSEQQRKEAWEQKRR